MLVIQKELADELDLLDLIIRRYGQPLERLGLDAIDLGLDLRNFLQRFRCEGGTDLVGTRCIGALRSNKGDRCEHDHSREGVHPVRRRHLSPPGARGGSTPVRLARRGRSLAVRITPYHIACRNAALCITTKWIVEWR